MEVFGLNKLSFGRKVERRLMEGEAVKALINRREMSEEKEKWCERIRGVGFVGKPFGEDAIDGA